MSDNLQLKGCFLNDAFRWKTGSSGTEPVMNSNDPLQHDLMKKKSVEVSTNDHSHYGKKNKNHWQGHWPLTDALNITFKKIKNLVATTL